MKICFFGDSICFGQFVSPHKIWITKIAESLQVRGIEFWLNNISHSGDTTRMALEKMPFDVQSHGIDIFYTQFGMNDCNYWLTDKGLPRVSKLAFEANLIEIINRAKNFGAQKVFVGANHISTKTDQFDHVDISYQQSNEQYNEIIRSVADSQGVTLIDHELSFKASIEKGVILESLLLEDQIHLSESGHQMYFSDIIEELMKAIESLK